MSAPPVDVHAYYRQVTDLEIGQIARELLGERITQESAQTLYCDCPNHRSQSHRSLHVWLDKQGWYCHGCGAGGDVLQLVEFVLHGVVTCGRSGRMPESHRQARDFLAARAGAPPLSQAGRTADEIAAAEEEHRITLRVREALAELKILEAERERALLSVSNPGDGADLGPDRHLCQPAEPSAAGGGAEGTGGTGEPALPEN